MAPKKKYLESIGVVAYNSDGKVLLVRMEGCRQWCLPHGVKGGNDCERRVRQILREFVCCDEVGLVRDTRIHEQVDFDDDDELCDPTTARIYDGKNLEFYIAELNCDRSSMRPQGKVVAFNMITPNYSGNYLSGSEAEVVKRIAQDYSLNYEEDLDAITSRLESESEARGKRR